MSSTRTTRKATRARGVCLRADEVRTLRGTGAVVVRRRAKPPHKAMFLPDDHWEIDIDEPGTAYMDDFGGRMRIACPLGAPGDPLWGREALWVSECGQYLARRADPSPGYSMPLYDVMARDGSAVWYYGRGKDGDLKMAATSWSNHGRDVGRGEKRRWVPAFEVGFIDDFDPTKTKEHPYGRSIGRKTAMFRKRLSATQMPRWASRFPRLRVASVAVERATGGGDGWEWVVRIERREPEEGGQ